MKDEAGQLAIVGVTFRKEDGDGEYSIHSLTFCDYDDTEYVFDATSAVAEDLDGACVNDSVVVEADKLYRLIKRHQLGDKRVVFNKVKEL